jgi:hypothetical protein
MSGASNVNHWLEGHGYESSPELVQRILHAAKNSTQVLNDAQLETLVLEHRRSLKSAAEPS